jgi:hypothetical protein
MFSLDNAQTIGHCLDSTERPAAAAVTLIANLIHGFALWPVSSRVESFWRISSDRQSGEWKWLHVDQVNAKEALGIFETHFGNVILSCLPSILHRVDLFDHFWFYGQTG